MNAFAKNFSNWVDKNEIKFIRFHPSVSNSSNYKINPILFKAISLGNLHRHHVVIVFKDMYHQVWKTETTIWGITDHHLLLKGHISIPLYALEEIELI